AERQRLSIDPVPQWGLAVRQGTGPDDDFSDQGDGPGSALLARADHVLAHDTDAQKLKAGEEPERDENAGEPDRKSARCHTVPDEVAEGDEERRARQEEADELDDPHRQTSEREK